MKRRLLGIAAALVAVLCVLNPNPFGNNVDVIYDESYFLTNALSALSQKRLPGLVFSASGSYYGAIQTDLVTAALVPVLGTLIVREGSLENASLFVAAHIGDLQHVTRLMNGLVVLACLFGLAWLARKQSADVRRALLLFGVLLAGNSLFMTGIHTGKVWILQLSIEVVLAVLVAVWQMRRLAGAPEPFNKKRYLDALVFFPFLTTLQAVTGVIAFAWTLYALLLRHVSLKELLAHALRRLPWLALLLALHASFFYRGWLEYSRLGSSPTNLSISKFVHPDGSVDYLRQFTWPLETLVWSQPVAVIGFLAAIGVGAMLWRANTTARPWIAILTAHPLLVGLYYHGVLGFGMFPRYVLPLSIFVCLSAALLLASRPKMMKAALTLSAVLAVAVSAKTTFLFWTPAAEKDVTAYLQDELNRPEVTLIVKTGQLSPPLNARSLAALDDRRAQFQRIALLMAHPAQADILGSFAPLVLFSTPSDPPRTPPTEGEVYVIDNDCSRRCVAGSDCRAFNEQACAVGDNLNLYPQEMTTLPDLFGAGQLGRPYFVRRQ